MKSPFSTRNKVLLIVTILAIVIAAGCAPIEVPPYYPEGCTMISSSVCRVDDPDKGVSCYVYFQQAISCVKLK